MGSTIYRTNLSIFEQEKTHVIDPIILNSIQLNWNSSITDNRYNICLFIMQEYKNIYPDFDLTDNIKINILKNIFKHEVYFSSENQNILFNFNIIKDFINNIYDIFYTTYNLNLNLKNTDIKKFRNKIHPLKTWLNIDNLSKIYKLINNNSNLKDIYNKYIQPINNKYVNLDDKNFDLNDFNNIPKYKPTKSDPIKIFDSLQELLYIYIIYSIKSIIISNYNSTITYTLSLLSLYNNNFDINNSINSTNINILINDFYNIEYKLIHKLYSENIKLFENTIYNINSEYKNIININNNFSINNNITPLHKLFTKHFDDTIWNKIYKNILKIDPNLDDSNNKTIFNNLYSKFKNKKLYIYDILNENSLIKSYNLLDLNLFNYIKNIDNKDKFNKFIFKKLLSTNITPYYYNYNNIFNNFKNSITYLSNFTYFNETINISNTITETRIPFDSIDYNIFFNYNNNIKFNPIYNNYNNSNNIIINNYNNILDNAIKFLLLHIYEEDITPHLIGVKRLFNYNYEFYNKYNDDTIYCSYTKLSKLQILNNILKLPHNLIIDLYNKIYNNNFNIINKIHYIGMNFNNQENIFGFYSILNNLTYQIPKLHTQYLYNFINLFIKSDTIYQNDKILKNILINFYSNPIHYSILFLKNDTYISNFIQFLNSPDIINKTQHYDIINIINPLLVFNDDIFTQIKIYYDDFNKRTINNIDTVLNYNITDLTSKISTIFPKFNLLNNNYINSHYLILFINNIKKIISIFINLPFNNDSKYNKNKYKYLKKFISIQDYNLLIKIIDKNHLFNSLLFDKKHLINYQFIFSKILQQFDYNFNHIYSNNDLLITKLIYYKILFIINNSINILTKQNIIISNTIYTSKYYWNYTSNSINNLQDQYDFNTSDSITIDVVNDDTFLNLFVQIINISYNDINQYITQFSSYSDTISFYNENDTHNKGGADFEYDNYSTFENELPPDEEEL